MAARIDPRPGPKRRSAGPDNFQYLVFTHLDGAGIIRMQPDNPLAASADDLIRRAVTGSFELHSVPVGILLLSLKDGLGRIHFSVADDHAVTIACLFNRHITCLLYTSPSPRDRG